MVTKLALALESSFLVENKGLGGDFLRAVVSPFGLIGYVTSHRTFIIENLRLLKSCSDHAKAHSHERRYQVTFSDDEDIRDMLDDIFGVDNIIMQPTRTATNRFGEHTLKDCGYLWNKEWNHEV